jgi:hypothetical protein
LGCIKYDADRIALFMGIALCRFCHLDFSVGCQSDLVEVFPIWTHGMGLEKFELYAKTRF